jgi:hypothetical protein
VRACRRRCGCSFVRTDNSAISVPGQLLKLYTNSRLRDRGHVCFPVGEPAPSAGAGADTGPTQLGLWSFVVAIAHGAGLMLVPIYLGLCRAADVDKGHEAAGALINANLGMAVLVSVVHSVAMIVAGGFLAWLVYRYLGLKFVSRSWFNLDATWAFSLVLVGALSLAISLTSRH